MYEIASNPEDMKPDVFHKTCPARFLLNKIAGKWSLLIIDALQMGPVRNGELKRRVEGISQKMLTQTLRELGDMRLISRLDMKTIPPHVEYSLTALGVELCEKICALDRWVEDNMSELIEHNKSIEIKRVDKLSC
ncbi:MAG: helix-turn-helix transcriptional regulator [Robiginitomaculum sp.]|nr:helix-turn-helix transcriptional regulator [Robiginitomaculum sp.]